MKRTILFVMLAFGAIALVSAQGNNRRGQGGGPRGGSHPHSQGQGYQRNALPAPEEASISGNLTIAQGMIAVVSNDTTYIARGLNRYIGFIDGLKEGAAVKLEGTARPNPQNNTIKYLQVQKLTLNGKEYDLAYPRQEVRPQQNVKPRQYMQPNRNGNHRMNNQPRFYHQQPRHRGRGMMRW